MPAFIKTPADEEKWNAIKHSVAKQRGKKVEDFTDRDWATVNAAWHKSEYDAITKSMSLMPKAPSLHIPYAMKMPKAKKMPNAMDKPSKFFKNEQIGDPKHPSVCKLRDFLENRVGRKQS
jgi:hypothetical protein